MKPNALLIFKNHYLIPASLPPPTMTGKLGFFFRFATERRWRQSQLRLEKPTFEMQTYLPIWGTMSWWRDFNQCGHNKSVLLLGWPTGLETGGP
jgi:hypothetical protein